MAAMPRARTTMLRASQVTSSPASLDSCGSHAASLALGHIECQETEGTVPTYQYACTACGHELEAVQSFSDDPLTECPACQGRLRKLFGSVGVVFKGPGFYRTDSRAGNNGAD